MTIGKLQYISQGNHLENIETACQAACKWIQLRVKNKSEQEVLQIAKEAKAICQAYSAQLIINDYPNIAKAIEADGIHLGKLDANHSRARIFIGKESIIGGTANTIEDIRNYEKEAAVDYVGVGPFRFTNTKKNLSPVLGLKGYQEIVDACKSENISLPLIAIGGIRLEDISAILATGVHGIAVSGLITNADNKAALVAAIQSKFK